MSRTSKSPRAVAPEALATARRALPAYASRFSRHGFTLAQHFACLVLKSLFRTDYRGVSAILADWPHLCAALELTHHGEEPREVRARGHTEVLAVRGELSRSMGWLEEGHRALDMVHGSAVRAEVEVAHPDGDVTGHPQPVVSLTLACGQDPVG